MTISILALKVKLNGKILLLRFFSVGYILTFNLGVAFIQSVNIHVKTKAVLFFRL